MTVMTKGQYRVGIAFNPSGDDMVADLKRMAALLIDTIEEIPSGADEVGSAWEERKRCKALAQTAVEEAAMWAVKAATKGPMA